MGIKWEIYRWGIIVAQRKRAWEWWHKYKKNIQACTLVQTAMHAWKKAKGLNRWGDRGSFPLLPMVPFLPNLKQRRKHGEVGTQRIIPRGARLEVFWLCTRHLSIIPPSNSRLPLAIVISTGSPFTNSSSCQRLVDYPPTNQPVVHLEARPLFSRSVSCLRSGFWPSSRPTVS